MMFSLFSCLRIIINVKAMKVMDQEEWEVQEIRDAREFDGALHYLVKWTGWPSEYDS
jgi:hypothetical protein